MLNKIYRNSQKRTVIFVLFDRFQYEGNIILVRVLRDIYDNCKKIFMLFIFNDLLFLINKYNQHDGEKA